MRVGGRKQTNTYCSFPARSTLLETGSWKKVVFLLFIFWFLYVWSIYFFCICRQVGRLLVFMSNFRTECYEYTPSKACVAFRHRFSPIPIPFDIIYINNFIIPLCNYIWSVCISLCLNLTPINSPANTSFYGNKQSFLVLPWLLCLQSQTENK